MAAPPKRRYKIIYKLISFATGLMKLGSITFAESL